MANKIRNNSYLIYDMDPVGLFSGACNNSEQRAERRNLRRKRSSRMMSRGQSIEYVALFSDPAVVIQQQQQQAEVVHENQDYGLLTRKVISVSEKEWDKCLDRRNSVRLHNKIENRSIFGLPTLHPTATFVIYWAFLMLLVDAIYTAFFLPMEVAFRERGPRDWRSICDGVVDVIYIFDFLLSFHVGYIIMYNGQKATSMEGRNIMYFYFFHGSFWVDLITVLSCGIQIVTVFFYQPENYHTGMARILLDLTTARMLRLVRVVWIIKMSYQTALFALEPFSLRIFTNSIVQMLNILYCLSTIVNLLGCFFFAVAKFGPGGIEHSWVAEQGLVESEEWQKYLASIYYTLTTVSTVGYGDIYPTNWMEQIAAILIILVGLVFFAFLVGMVNEFLSATSRRMSSGQMYKDKMRMVSEWMNTRGLSPSLRNDIYKFYSVLASYDENPDSHFIEELPMQLRSKAVFEMILPLVDFIPVLQEVPEEILKQFASRLIPLNPPPGGDLCHEGDPADCVWLLLEGVVGVSRFQKDLHEIHAPAFLGDGVVLADSLNDIGNRRLCTFTCKTVCRVMQMDSIDLMHIMQLHPAIKDAMLAKLRRFVDKCLAYFPMGDPQLETVQNHIDQQMIRPKIDSSIIFNKNELKDILSPKTLTPTVSLATNWAEENYVQENVQLLLNNQHFGSDNELLNGNYTSVVNFNLQRDSNSNPNPKSVNQLNRNIKRVQSDPRGRHGDQIFSLARTSQY